MRVTVPSRAFSILPHFAIVGHEIGHALYRKAKTSPINRAKSPHLNKGLLSRIRARLDADNPEASKALSDKQVGDATKAIFTNWINELVADAFGFYLMGPAMFFALSEFLLITGRGIEGSCDHPPNSLRRDLLYRRLTAGGRSSFAAGFKRKTKRELTITINNALLPTEVSAEKIYADIRAGSRDTWRSLTACTSAELVDQIIGFSDNIYDYARAYIVNINSRLIYTPDKFERDLSVHVDGMLYAIPPIECAEDGGVIVPADFVSILNIGWVVLLTRLDQLKLGGKNVSVGRRIEVLQGLILKAVELSEARRTWSDLDQQRQSTFARGQ